MQEPKYDTPPFKTLGNHLKYLRERLNQSLAEVSGAVEIEVGSLDRIEQGIERPSEDILMLLINHFAMQDHEAVQLWEQAGYDRRAAQDSLSNLQEEVQSGGNKPLIVVLGLDMRIMYTDGAQITADKTGVVMNFSQGGGQGHATAMPVARLGMSLEQAETVLQNLQQAVLQARYRGQKSLPAPAASSSPGQQDRQQNTGKQ